MSWLDTVFKFIAHGRYTTVTPSLSNGEMGELRLGPDGRLLVDADSVTALWADGGSAVSERVIKASAGRLHQIIGRNVGADAFLFVFNHATTGGTRPANGSAAEMFVPIFVPAGQHFSLELPRSRAFSTGLYIGASSTGTTFTYSAASSFLVSAEYE